MYKPEPDEHQVVIVLAEASKEKGYKWTSGRTMGDPRNNGETFEVLTHSQSVKPDKVWAHVEDLKHPDHVDSIKSLNEKHRK